MSLSETRVLRPHLRDDEARVIETAVRLAVDSVLNVLAGVDCARAREHERALAEREGEIRRLALRERRLERELRVLRRRWRRRGDSVLSDPEDTLDPDGGDPWPGYEDEGDEGGRGHREMSFSLGLLHTPPSQVSTPNQVLAAPSPGIKSAAQQDVMSRPPAESFDAPDARQILLHIPVVKEEPTPHNMAAACDGSELHTPLQSHGDEDSSSLGSEAEEDSAGEEYRPSSPEGDNPKRTASDSWHHAFEIPWKKMSATIKKRLERGERPSAPERREVIRVIAGELLATCHTAGKKHVMEIARKVVMTYPKSFQDEIAGEVVGSGYDSIIRQMLSNIYNVRRSDNPRVRKRAGGGRGGGGGSSREAAAMTKRRRSVAYGCINPEPLLPAGETRASQKRKTEELQLMFRNRDMDTKKMEKLMTDTFASQRQDLLSPEKDTRKLLEKWPYLFQAAGMRIHFRELTGTQISESFEDAMARKFRRILEYFEFLPKDPAGRAGDLVLQTQEENRWACGTVLLLLAHFNEQQDKMFVQVDDATAVSEVDTTALPWTPCIVACGESPLKAEAYMVAVDRVVISERLSTFEEALHMMFFSYYIHNLDYPAELLATMEFLQRCIFKVNPHLGSKLDRRVGVSHAIMNPKVLGLLSRMSEFERR
ncbi:unnamed protein product [Merluccius merluccius]